MNLKKTIILALILLVPFGYYRREVALRDSCLANLQQLGKAVDQYMRDNDNKLPDLSSPKALRASLDRYVKDPTNYSCPKGGLYNGNTAFSHAEFEKFDVMDTPIILDPGIIHLWGINLLYVDRSAAWEKRRDPIPLRGRWWRRWRR